MSSSTSSSDVSRPDAPEIERAGGGPGYLAVWAATTVLGVGLLGLVNYAVDPLQFYRLATPPAVWSENQRYQIPGLARHADYETIVVGTSHAENFLPSLVEDRLGERAVKLAISGSTAREQRLVVEKAIATGKVRHVIWILDRIAFTKPADALGRSGDDFPIHLYREDATTPFRYLISTDTLGLSLASVFGLGHRDLDSLNAWWDDHAFGAAPVLADWRRRLAVTEAVRRRSGRPFADPGPAIRQSVALNLVTPIREHPHVRFDLVFPPYSMLSYLADYADDPRAPAARRRYKADVVAATARWPNVRVFDFQGIESIALDFRHFKDLEHFDLALNELVLDAIASGRHVVDPERYADALHGQAEQLERYRADVCRPGSPQRALCPTRSRALAPTR